MLARALLALCLFCPSTTDSVSQTYKAWFRTPGGLLKVGYFHQLDSMHLYTQDTPVHTDSTTVNCYPLSSVSNLYVRDECKHKRGLSIGMITGAAVGITAAFIVDKNKAIDVITESGPDSSWQGVLVGAAVGMGVGIDIGAIVTSRKEINTHLTY